jgi:signal transduction histidine kinase
MINIRKSFSTKLTLAILLLAAPIFMISLGILFTQSRHIVRQEAVGRANSVLSSAMQRIYRNMATIETATNANSWLITEYLQPDSILSLSNRIVRFNPHIDGCSISTEPYIFQRYDKNFSAYSVRQGDSVSTVIEEPYDYFGKVWYKEPRDRHEGCWVVYYDESDSLALTIDGLIASYSKPVYDTEGRFVAVISTDLSLLRLSKAISKEEKPYPNSYFMMLDNEGRYFIHPDSTRLFTQTIFTGTDPSQQAKLIALGHEMTKGNTGSMTLELDGQPCLVCYQPVPGTVWSLALVCPDRDMLAGYHRLSYIIGPLLIIGLLLIILLSYRTAAHAIRPLGPLLEKTQSIAEGNMEVHIPRSQREDAIGHLQNSFATMLQSLNFHMGSVRYSTEQAQRRNEELAQATRLAQEADHQKTEFIKNVTHQVRTPLNIIMGFAQIMSGSSVNNLEGIPDEELKVITDTMDHNSKLLNRLLLMLFDSSETGFNEELNNLQQDRVPCNDVAREAISFILLHYPTLKVGIQSDVDDDFCILTNRLYLMRSLRELLYNSAKYSDGQHIVMRITTTQHAQGENNQAGPTIRFIVEDKGKGIAEDYQDLMFKFFTKVDDLSEGLGLGLPLAKRHAQNLGGDLLFDTTYHDGCRFIIELPIK